MPGPYDTRGKSDKDYPMHIDQHTALADRIKHLEMLTQKQEDVINSLTASVVNILAAQESSIVVLKQAVERITAYEEVAEAMQQFVDELANASDKSEVSDVIFAVNTSQGIAAAMNRIELIEDKLEVMDAADDN